VYTLPGDPEAESGLPGEVAISLRDLPGGGHFVALDFNLERQWLACQERHSCYYYTYYYYYYVYEYCCCYYHYYYYYYYSQRHPACQCVYTTQRFRGAGWLARKGRHIFVRFTWGRALYIGL
jgi:hypothetical protein